MYKTLNTYFVQRKRAFFQPLVFFHSHGVLQNSGNAHAHSAVPFRPGCGSYTSCNVRIHNRKILCVIIIQTAAVTPSAGWTLVDPFLCFLLKAGRPLLSPATRIHTLIV